MQVVFSAFNTSLVDYAAGLGLATTNEDWNKFLSLTPKKLPCVRKASRQCSYTINGEARTSPTIATALVDIVRTYAITKPDRVKDFADRFAWLRTSPDGMNGPREVEGYYVKNGIGIGQGMFSRLKSLAMFVGDGTFTISA
jgi:hypothetical protein